MVIEVNGNDKVAMLMCNTTELAFGPVHKSVRGNAVSEMRDFVSTLDTDARVLFNDGQLQNRYNQWLQNLRTPTNRPKGY